MIKILVADSVEAFCAAVEDAFGDRCMVLTCHDGRAALRMICSERPEVVWLDTMLPGMDGLTILRATELSGFMPRVIACVRHYNDRLLERLTDLQVCDIIQKPFALAAALMKLEGLVAASAAEKADAVSTADELILETLQLLGLVGRRSGHKSLLCALRLMVADPQCQVTKTVYPAVAAKCDGTAQSVERGIRFVISLAWEKRDPLFWELYFPEHIEHAPSNGVFLERIAERIRTVLTKRDNRKPPASL